MKPSLLVSYAHLRRNGIIPLPGRAFDEWVLDSGAYTAANTGEVIDVELFIQFARDAAARDVRLRHVFALDVIGNAEASLKNALKAQAEGVRVIPTWHAGEPIEFAQEMKLKFPRIALGGLVARLRNNRAQKLSTREKIRHATNFFNAVWPAWVHGFGCTGDEIMDEFPFSSVDSTTWNLRPSMYGSWKTYGRLPLRFSSSLRGSLRTEIEFFMRRESRHDSIWRRELALVGCDRFRVRFACAPATIKWFDQMFPTTEPTQEKTT